MFDWVEFQRLAEELSGGEPTNICGREGRERSAMSRSYYAVHGRARDVLASYPEQHSLSDDVHSAVAAAARILEQLAQLR